jgi:hypothetical protein
MHLFVTRLDLDGFSIKICRELSEEKNPGQNVVALRKKVPALPEMGT